MALLLEAGYACELDTPDFGETTRDTGHPLPDLYSGSSSPLKIQFLEELSKRALKSSSFFADKATDFHWESSNFLAISAIT